MQKLPPDLVARLRRGLQPTFLTEDFVFEPSLFEPFADFGVADESVHIARAPRVVHRRIQLMGPPGAQGAAHVSLGLGVEGSESAFEFLLHFCGGFERSIPTEAIVVLQDPPLEIGDTGIAWSWEVGERWDAFVFVRRNVLVAVSGVGPLEARPLARALDHAITRLGSVDNPGENPYFGAELLVDHDGEAPVVVRPGGRLSIHPLPSQHGLQLFSFATSGSVNKDPGGGLYYRAELEPDVDVLIELLAVGRGIKPLGARQTLHVGA